MSHFKHWVQKFCKTIDVFHNFSLSKRSTIEEIWIDLIIGRLKWIKERVSLYFGGGGLVQNRFKLSLINLYWVKYLKEAFNFWFQELCSSVTWLATPNCLYKFETKFTIVCSCNLWLILFYANGFNHQVWWIKRGLKDLFLLLLLQRISIGEGLGLGKNWK